MKNLSKRRVKLVRTLRGGKKWQAICIPSIQSHTKICHRILTISRVNIQNNFINIQNERVSETSIDSHVNNKHATQEPIKFDRRCF